MPDMLSAADLIFDDATHTSRTPDGRNVPHVTHILSATNVAEDFEQLTLRVRGMRQRLEFASARGVAVHADCHAYDDNDLDLNDCDPNSRKYVEAWIEAREALGLDPVAHGRERQIFQPIDWYTGILDGVFRQRSTREFVLVDIKTGDPDKAAAHLQTAAYGNAWNLERFSDAYVTKRWAIHLRPGFRIPYRVYNYSDRLQDYDIFKACLTVFNHHPTRREPIV